MSQTLSSRGTKGASAVGLPVSWYFDPEIFVSTRGSRASFYRQPRHMGMAGNWNTCVERARGRWIHLLHQDDLVFPGFYQRLRKGIDTDASIGAAFCHHSWIDAGGRREPARSRIPQSAPGILSDWLEYVFVGLSFTTPSIVVTTITCAAP